MKVAGSDLRVADLADPALGQAKALSNLGGADTGCVGVVDGGLADAGQLGKADLVLGTQFGREPRTKNRVGSCSDAFDLTDRFLGHSTVVVRELIGNKGSAARDGSDEAPRLQKSDRLANDDL